MKSKNYSFRAPGRGVKISIMVICAIIVIALLLIAGMSISAEQLLHEAEKAYPEIDQTALALLARRQILVLSGLGVILTALLLGGIALLLHRSQLRQLERIRHAIEHIAAGEHTYRMGPQADDESEEVAQALNELAGMVQAQHVSLCELNVSLDKQVKERTAVLLQARDSAEATSKAKSNFLAILSHELRTPLAAMLGYRDLLELTAQRSGHKELLIDLEKMRVSGRHLLILINNVLDLAKLEAGRMEMISQPFMLKSLLDQIRTTIEPLANKQGNQFTISTDESIRILHSDTIRLRQILLNLVGNASKFTRRGSIFFSVGRQLPELPPAYLPAQMPRSPTLAENAIVFVIADTGPGIPQSQLDHLFELFVQADTTMSRPYGGMGLGLALSYRFVQAMHGEITVASVVGRGSVFAVFLPSAISPLQSQPSDEYPSFRPASSWQPQTVTRPPSVQSPLQELKTALLVGERSAAQTALDHAIRAIGWVPIKATGRDIALRFATSMPLNQIMIDLTTAGDIAWPLLRELKAEPRAAGVPVTLVAIDTPGRLILPLGTAEYLAGEHDLQRLIGQLTSLQSHIQAPEPMLLRIGCGPEGGPSYEAAISRAGWSIVQFEGGPAALEAIDLDCIQCALIHPTSTAWPMIAGRLQQRWGEQRPILVIASAGAEHSRETLSNTPSLAESSAQAVTTFGIELGDGRWKIDGR